MAINLLPWREDYQQRQRLLTLIILFITLTITMTTLVIWLTIILKLQYVQQKQLSIEQQRALQVEHQYKILKRQVTEYNLAKQQLSLINALTALASHMPDGVYLTHINYTPNKLVMQGHAYLPKDILQFKNFISTAMQMPTQLVESIHLGNTLKFNLQIKQVN